jgi:hypothetical protein
MLLPKPECKAIHATVYSIFTDCAVGLSERKSGTDEKVAVKPAQLSKGKFVQ